MTGQTDIVEKLQRVLQILLECIDDLRTTSPSSHVMATEQQTEAMKRLYQKLAEEGGGNWAIDVISDVERIVRMPQADPADHLVGGEPANKADAILRVVRRMIVAENRHLEYPEGTHQRDELDHLLAELISFTTKDVDEALRIVRRRRAALATATEGSGDA